jgi:hypothetical protein
MNKRMSGAEKPLRRLTHREQRRAVFATEQPAEVERDKPVPSDEPPQLTARYGRTSSLQQNQPTVQIDWLPEPAASEQWSSSGLDHELLRADFYHTLYEIAECDSTVRAALSQLDFLARRIAAGDLGASGVTTDRYWLSNRPGSKQIAAWLEEHGLQDIPFVGSDIIASIGAFERRGIMGEPDQFRLGVYADSPGPATYPPGWFPHKPGQPRWDATIDPDSIEISLHASWRKNARTQSMKNVKEEILNEVGRLLDEELSPIYELAESLGVRPRRARNTERDMWWLVLCHFPDAEGTYRIPIEFIRRARELKSEFGDAKPDTADQAVRELAKKLGIQLDRKHGAPLREKPR